MLTPIQRSKTETRPLVTVHLMCYNQGQYVLDALRSLLLQTYKKIELLISDDASSDDSRERILTWLDEQSLEAKLFFHKENLGVCKTANELVQHSQGEFIAVLHADDIWYKDHLSILLATFDSLPSDYGIVYSDADRIDENGNRASKTFITERRSQTPLPDGNIHEALVRCNWIIPTTAMIRRECLNSVGPYDESLIYEDYDMWLRMSRVYKFRFSGAISCAYRTVSSSHSRQNGISNPWRIKSRFMVSKKVLDTDRQLPNHLQAHHINRMQMYARKLYLLQHPEHRKYIRMALGKKWCLRLMFCLAISRLRARLTVF
jgi:glycosyltransferase involved in cell wall biosynthesis